MTVGAGSAAADPLRGLRDAAPRRTSTSPAAPSPDVPASRSSGSASSAAPTSPRTPQPVPHYTTLRELGRGAMGVVYQARHNQTGADGRAEADRPRDAPPRGRPIDRFLREMSVISQLKHPNIVEWLEQGMTRGQFWFAMEYVAGHEPRGPGQRRARAATRSTRPAAWPARSSRGWSTPTRWGSSTATSSPRTS